MVSCNLIYREIKKVILLEAVGSSTMSFVPLHFPALEISQNTVSCNSQWAMNQSEANCTKSRNTTQMVESLLT